MYFVAGMGMESPEKLDHGLRDALRTGAGERGGRELDAIAHFEEGLGCGLDDVGTDARAPVSALIVLHVDQRLALGVFAGRYAAYFELPQYDIHARGTFNGLQRRVDRPVARGVHLDLAAIAVLEAHRGIRGLGAVERSAQVEQ